MTISGPFANIFNEEELTRNPLTQVSVEINDSGRACINCIRVPPPSIRPVNVFIFLFFFFSSLPNRLGELLFLLLALRAFPLVEFPPLETPEPGELRDGDFVAGWVVEKVRVLQGASFVSKHLHGCFSVSMF